MEKEHLISWLTDMKRPLDPDEKWTITLKATGRRSMNANAYYWVLHGKLLNILRHENPRLTSNDLHVRLLADYGQTAIDSHGNPIWLLLRKDIDPLGFCRYLDLTKVVTIDGEEYNEWRGLMGSSEFDKKEMGLFLSGVVAECKEQGIETLSPDKLYELVERWEGELSGRKKDDR